MSQNPGIALMLISVVVLPIGFISMKDESKIVKRDAEIGTFLRSLRGVCTALGTTINSALTRLDLDVINVLRTTMKRLYTKLTTGIRSKPSWGIFIDETGSELAYRSVCMFYDVIEVGGSAAQVGQQAVFYVDKIAPLQARQRTVSMPFRWLYPTIHSAVILIMVFITEVIVAFGGMVGRAQEAIPSVSGAPSIVFLSSFDLSGLEIMHELVIPLVLCSP